MRDSSLWYGDLHLHTNLSNCAPRDTVSETYLPFLEQEDVIPRVRHGDGGFPDRQADRMLKRIRDRNREHIAARIVRRQRLQRRHGDDRRSAHLWRSHRAVLRRQHADLRGQFSHLGNHGRPCAYLRLFGSYVQHQRDAAWWHRERRAGDIP